MSFLKGAIASCIAACIAGPNHGGASKWPQDLLALADEHETYIYIPPCAKRCVMVEV